MIDAADPDFTLRFKWFIDISEIAPGKTAILGNNRWAFFAIHYVAICMITVSLVASLMVIVQIHSKWRRTTCKLDFPVRFPLYLAIADFCWGVSHLVDHLFLVISQVIPSSTLLENGLAMNIWFFFGYQQLMHASVAGYTYLRVVHRKQLNLGRWEWKLHLLWFCFLVGTIPVFYLMDAFGSQGYCMVYNQSNFGGLVLLLTICLTCTFNSCCTTIGYYRLRRTLLQLRSRLRDYGNNLADPTDKLDSLGSVQRTVASQCLTTYVYVAACLYCPLTISIWFSLVVKVTIGAIEPLSSFLVVVVANSSGWANAAGYWYNEKIKKKHEQEKLSKIKSYSTDTSKTTT